LVRGRVGDAAARVPAARRVELPSASETYPLFSREAVDVHADLWREHRDLYGENVAYKLERAFQVTDDEVEAASRARERYRDGIAEEMVGLDLLLTPTLAMVAPLTGIGDLALRDRMILTTYPWNAVGAPALALPCGPAENGLPASVQIVGRAGDDAVVLAAGRALEEALSA
ncbi:MAG: aspartyl-tRNA(Asn)/glutamyl-tRNA(Gln) amidotransferase subunit, partial [Solirubrobacteraceae bacterium]|nr:aspartyl-tRNA(Asn)/glutamyl-tRNA(Gln) amidotransferase subunit [Solirubrobacteraceae bacterium]